jgi:hypothetical protein
VLVFSGIGCLVCALSWLQEQITASRREYGRGLFGIVEEETACFTRYSQAGRSF